MRMRALLVVAVGLWAVGPAATARAAEEICVAVVVDYRDLAGAPAAPSRHCAKVPNRSTGFEILVVRARALGRPQPRSENGLVCAIDGLPERGCGESGNGGYRYWAYFHRAGDGSWTYSNRGAADYRVIDDPSRSDDDRPSEGWVWVDGGAEGSVRPPGIPYDDVCPPAAKPSAAPSARPTPASPSRTPAPSSRTATPRRSAGATSRPAVPPATATSATAPGIEASGSTSPAGLPATPDAAPPIPETTTTAAADVPLADAGRDDASDGGFPTSTVAGLAAVAALGVAAAVRRRRGGPE